MKANPHEVTILAIGPLTDLALAFRTAPEIVPLVKRIVYMGGAFDVPGNVTPAAEFNWWFDPEAVRIVLREPIEHVVVPLDVTDTARFGKDVYDRISGADTPIAKLFAAEYADTFAKDPNARPSSGTRWPPPGCSTRRSPPTCKSARSTSTSSSGPTTAARSATPRTRRPACRRPGS